MPLTRGIPPADADAAVAAALQRFAGVPDSRLHALEGLRPAELAATAPHQVFNLGLDDLASAAGALGSTRATGWRYLLRQDGRVVASAETVTGPGGGAQFSHFNSGPFVASTASAIEVAEGLDQTRDAAYELRLLHVPALYTMALWLHGAGDDDVLIPLAPAADGVEADRAYPAGELLAILADKAGRAPRFEPGDTRGS